MTVYISIGNSDNKLSQEDWVHFVDGVRAVVQRHASEVHGQWFSAPDSIYQNFCICAVIDPEDVAGLKFTLGVLCKRYRQDSIAWAEAVTDLIRG